MELDFRLTRIESNAGDTVDLPLAGVTCIVGGNNVGKSQLLRDIVTYVSEAGARPVTLRAVEFDKSPFPADESIEEWLPAVATVNGQGKGYPPTYTPLYGGQIMRRDDILSFWNHQERLGPLAGFFVWHATAGSLGGWAAGSLSGEMMHMGGQPLARIYRDGELDAEISNLCHEAFGFSLTFDRVNGNFRYRVGEPGIPAPTYDRPSIEYADAVSALEPLDTQGDGVRSFLGLAVNVVAGATRILLIDEPEAFLHPAQARALGRWLATQAVARDRQILVATHDRDFVLGLLDSDAPVKVVRVNRTGLATRLHQLEAEQVAAVWAEPVLRYSNVLQGLFHQQVIVCESDADCRFYGAVLDALASELDRRAVVDDTLFVPSGGKQRAATLVEALARVGVSAHAIVDFDILRSRSDLRGLVIATGGLWTDEMNGDYVTLANSANQNGLWDQLKKQGLNGPLRGEPHAAASRLLQTLRGSRVHIVPVGEMEDFDKSIAVDGAAWVSAVLERNGHTTNVAAREFMAPLAAPLT